MEYQTASQRYAMTWQKFAEELKTAPSTTLRSVCRTLHTNTNGMCKWLARQGYSVMDLKASIQKTRIDSKPAFARIVPKDVPNQDIRPGLDELHITFASGTTISARHADAESVARIVMMYERKEGEACTR